MARLKPWLSRSQAKLSRAPISRDDADATGGFGDVYYGDYITKEGDQFAAVGKVVAKKSKRSYDASAEIVSH